MKKAQLGKQPEIFSEILDFSTDTRLRSNQTNKIKIDKNLKKGNIIYNLCKEWNDCDPKLRMSRNEHHLKNIFQSDIKEQKMKSTCKIRKCYMCKTDKHLNYERYMKK